MSDAAAFFDVDGTIAEGDIVRCYAFLRTMRMGLPRRLAWTALFLVRVPYYIALDRLSRRRFSEAFYRNYANWTPQQLRERAREHFERVVQDRIYPAARRQVCRHQQQGDAIVLVTNSLEEIVRPLARHLGVSEVMAARLEERQGRFSGRLSTGPLTNSRKAEAARAFARKQGLDLRRCHAYADSLDDVAMLEAVGQPRVVNPGRHLRRLAERRQWTILEWRLEKSRLGRA